MDPSEDERDQSQTSTTTQVTRNTNACIGTIIIEGRAKYWEDRREGEGGEETPTTGAMPREYSIDRPDSPRLSLHSDSERATGVRKAKPSHRLRCFAIFFTCRAVSADVDSLWPMAIDMS